MYTTPEEARKKMAPRKNMPWKFSKLPSWSSKTEINTWAESIDSATDTASKLSEYYIAIWLLKLIQYVLYCAILYHKKCKFSILTYRLSFWSIWSLSLSSLLPWMPSLSLAVIDFYVNLSYCHAYLLCNLLTITTINRSNPRKMVKTWAEKEMRNLKRLQAAGIRCPHPCLLKQHVLIMDFLGNDGYDVCILRMYVASSFGYWWFAVTPLDIFLYDQQTHYSPFQP